VEPQDQIFEIEFKGHRREFFGNPFNLQISKDEWVIVEAERGEDMGFVHLILDRERKLEMIPENPHKILRQAGYEDRDKLAKNRDIEVEALSTCKEMIGKHGLDMKLVDVESQFDGNKMTFYFTADERVDFRALVKDLASTYRTRIELRQIGVRDEAKRIGGYGICGLKQCCTTFLREFEPISTQLARDQNLSLNPAKISGNCGRLLCCLMYEQTHYLETTKKFPAVGAEIEGKQGQCRVVSVNVFRQQMIVRYEDGLTDDLSWKEYNQILKRREFIQKQKAGNGSN
jgi:cell fate regulator YaaT (PSP1 superfamily)